MNKMNLISKTLAVCLVLLLVAPAFAKRNPQDRVGQDPIAAIDFANWIDANRILMFVTNKGSFAYDNGSYFGKSDGLYFPFTSTDDIFSGRNDLTPIYAGSIWMGAQVAEIDTLHPYWIAHSADLAVEVGDTLVTSGQHDTDWGIGPIIDGMPAEGDANAAYRVYVLYRDSLAENPNNDYLNWPVAQGAPVDTLTGLPLMLGDEMHWGVYNDLDIGKHVGSRGTAGRGLGIEVRQTAFAFAREGALGNIVFMRFRAYNKGPYDLTNMFISLWSDPDLGDANDDYVGCDTLTSLGFCYNSQSEDANYGSTPPATGYDFFQGPIVPGDPSDTAVGWNFTLWPGMKNLGMVSFNRYVNPFGPDTPTDSYEFMNGLNKDGTPVIVPGSSPPETTMYYNSGDPVEGTGFLDVSPDDRRFMQSTGPIDMAQGDSVEVVAAILCGQSADYLASITELRAVDDFAQSVYDRMFQLPSPPAPPDVTVSNMSNQVVLTWGTRSEDDPGDYPFEGYAVFQGPSAGGPWEDTLGWFDILNGMGAVPDVRFDPVIAENVRYAAKPGTDKGLEHTISLRQDYVTSGQLINYKQYYYRVEAYSADTTQASGEHTLTSATIVTAMPQPPVVGTNYNTETGIQLTVNHTLGTSPGSAEAYIIDPTKVTGHDYKIVFTDFYVELEYDTISVSPLEIDTIHDTIEGWVWHVVDSTTGDTVVNNWSNQSDVEGNNYPVADGILFKAFGPPPSIELFSVVANANGPIDPPESGAAPWADFPVPTDVDPDGYPTSGQQADTLMADGWLFHTADNGGSCAGGERYYFDHTLYSGEVDGFLSRSVRNDNIARVGPYDYEMRFTGSYDDPGTNGGYAIEWYLDDNVFWVPFEIWQTGINTPNDPSDDVRLVPFIIDDGDDNTYNLESYGCIDSVGHTGGDGEHSVSGGDNDPFTDWVYWFLPTDQTPGEAGYQANEDMMLAGGYDASLIFGEVFARTVLVSWNAGVEPPFGQEIPEVGTIFRITTAKPNTQSDVYTLSTSGMEPSVRTSGTSEMLGNIKAVPNPYYLFAEDYDPSLRNHQLKFTYLPDNCTITIYSLGGDLVETIEHSGGTEAIWDLQNRFGIPVASGIYIYVVNAPGFGEMIGKMAIFTEVELLEQF